MDRRDVSLLALLVSLVGCADEGGEDPAYGSTLASDLSSAFFVALADDRLVVAEAASAPDGAIVTVSTSSGATQTVIDGIDDPCALATADDFAYWVEAAAGAVRRVALDGGAAETLAQGLADPSAIVVVGGDAYVVEDDVGIVRVSADGSSERVYTAEADVLVGLATDGVDLYFTMAWDLPGGEIRRLALADGSVATIASGLGAPFAIAVDEISVCWQELQGGTIGCVPKSGGTVAPIGATPLLLDKGGPLLALDPEYVFAPAGWDGLLRFPRGGGLPTISALTDSPFGVRGVVVDDKNAYWVDGLAARTTPRNYSVPTGGGGGGDGCEPYPDGFMGEFDYVVEDPETMMPQTRTVRLTIAVECIAGTDEAATFNVVRAIADHPVFGCGPAPCNTPGSTLQLPGRALLPYSGDSTTFGLSMLFPNGSNFITLPGMDVDSQGINVSSPPGATGYAWQPGTLPPGGEDILGASEAPRWSLVVTNAPP